MSVLEVRDLAKHFPIHGGLLQRQVGAVKAVDGVSFTIAKGETLGLVGESGCGKSTVGKTILKLIEPTAGRILLGGEDVTALKPGAMWPHRRRIQTIFQDPYSSMNPRLSAGTIVGEPLENFGLSRGAETKARVAALFERGYEVRGKRVGVILPGGTVDPAMLKAFLLTFCELAIVTAIAVF